MGAWDLLVVGAGAAGLSAAIFAAESDRELRILVAERAQKVGAKILISGGGRCNVTHTVVRPTDFNGRQPIVRNILAAFDESETRRWFEAMQVDLKVEDTGKLFPTSDSARTVVDALLRRCRELDVSIATDCRIDAIERVGDRFHAVFSQGTIETDLVILATGGRSLPRTGSDGSGWQLASKLGHSVTETHPALVPLVLQAAFFHARLSGVSLPVELSVVVAGKRVDRRVGSLLFTHFGISGPVVLDASRHWTIAAAAGEAPQLLCNFLPESDLSTVDEELIRAARERPKLRLRTLLEGMLPARLAQILTERDGLDQLTLAQLSRVQRRELLRQLTALELPVERARGWDFAEVTAGGVPLAEIDYRTMHSRRSDGLYLVGEMLDCDGRIGGFNFQWAWATGFVAGRACADAHRRRRSDASGERSRLV